MDKDGKQLQLYKGIVNYRRNKQAIDKADQYCKHGGTNIKKKTTTGWDLEVEWVDGSTSWVSLKDLKESNSLKFAQYAVNNCFDLEPAFDWWVKEHLKWHKRMIKMSQRCHIKPGY